MITMYIVCFLMGVALSVVSFVSGLDRVNVFDHVFGHHAGHAPRLASHHAPRLVARHGPHTPHAGPVQKSVVSPFNAAAMTAFLAWFGGTGIVLHQITAWAEMGIGAAAIGTGVIGGSVVNRFIRALVSREKPLEATSMIGVIARVTSPIREGGTGEVVFVLNGTRKVSAARADTGAAIEKGMEVVVVKVEKGIAYVGTWDELAAISPEH